jgi:uncharacterized protein YegP (UPF0339 family)
MSIWSWLASLTKEEVVEVKVGVWEVYVDRAQSYRFRLKDGEETLVPSGHPYATSAEAVADIDRVKAMAAASPVKVIDAP